MVERGDVIILAASQGELLRPRRASKLVGAASRGARASPLPSGGPGTHTGTFRRVGSPLSSRAETKRGHGGRSATTRRTPEVMKPLINSRAAESRGA